MPRRSERSFSECQVTMTMVRSNRRQCRIQERIWTLLFEGWTPPLLVAETGKHPPIQTELGAKHQLSNINQTVHPVLRYKITCHMSSVVGENVALLQQAKLVAVRSRSINFIGLHSTLAQIQIAAIAT
jgi:hypothetical protein